MSETLADLAIPPQFPDRTQLPQSDGTFVKNFQECYLLHCSIFWVWQWGDVLRNVPPTA
ncbi:MULTISPECIES: hypothetical protein [Nostoc]|uniref:hypothetical protein n=1 Tax=Nostoc TaxID=1177 RepID=UPI001F5532DA|nr:MULTISPECIES: hypothetical protein [Nostoc]